VDRAEDLGLQFDTNPAQVSGAGVTQARPIGSEMPAPADAEPEGEEGEEGEEPEEGEVPEDPEDG
jgi:hypothetical protein